MTSLTPDLQINWRFQNTNHDSCRRNADGSITCTSDHPFGFEWCVNAPAIDGNGTVFSNSEDGNLYEIDRNGVLLNLVFTNLAIGAAYTPLSIGPDGKIYTQNAGKLFVTGN
jgi:outer membrane protein assembly factor BamB